LKIQRNEFTIFIKNKFGYYKKYKEIHQQRIYGIDELKSTLEQNRFKIVGAFDGFSLKAANTRSERIHFVVKKVL
jgi:hypothetical protein